MPDSYSATHMAIPTAHATGGRQVVGTHLSASFNANSPAAIASGTGSTCSV